MWANLVSLSFLGRKKSLGKKEHFPECWQLRDLNSNEECGREKLLIRVQISASPWLRRGNQGSPLTSLVVPLPNCDSQIKSAFFGGATAFLSGKKGKAFQISASPSFRRGAHPPLKKVFAPPLITSANQLSFSFQRRHRRFLLQETGQTKSARPQRPKVFAEERGKASARSPPWFAALPRSNLPN